MGVPLRVSRALVLWRILIDRKVSGKPLQNVQLVRFLAECRARDNFCGGRAVAIKVIPAHLLAVGMHECRNLGRMTAAHAGGPRRVIKMLDRFIAEGCLCIVFACLGSSLADARRSGRLASVSASLLRGIALHGMQALAEVHNAGMIHADVKPHNMLMGTRAAEEQRRAVEAGAAGPVPPSLPLGAAAGAAQGFVNPTNNSTVPCPENSQVTLIDLGNAIVLDGRESGAGGFDVQPLGYRAPEVLLACPSFDQQIDVWGMGMVLLEMVLGARVVDAGSVQQALGIVSDLFGPLPPTLLQRSTLSPQAGHGKARSPKPDGMVTPGSCSHCAVAVGLLLRQQAPHWAAVPHLVGFLGGCLALDPVQRMSPLQALQHPFLEALFPLRTVLPPRAVQAIRECSAPAGGISSHGPAGTPSSGTVIGAALPSGDELPSKRGKKRSRQGGLSGLAALMS